MVQEDWGGTRCPTSNTSTSQNACTGHQGSSTQQQRGTASTGPENWQWAGSQPCAWMVVYTLWVGPALRPVHTHPLPDAPHTSPPAGGERLPTALLCSAHSGTPQHSMLLATKESARIGRTCPRGDTPPPPPAHTCRADVADEKTNRVSRSDKPVLPPWRNSKS